MSSLRSGYISAKSASNIAEKASFKNLFSKHLTDDLTAIGPAIAHFGNALSQHILFDQQDVNISHHDLSKEYEPEIALTTSGYHHNVTV